MVGSDTICLHVLQIFGLDMLFPHIKQTRIQENQRVEGTCFFGRMEMAITSGHLAEKSE